MRPAVASFYAIAGRTLCVRTFDDRAAALAREFVGDFHLSPHPAPPIISPDVITIEVNAAAPLPPVPPGFETFGTEIGSCHTDREEYYFHINGSLILATPRASRAVRIWIGDASPDGRTPPHAGILPYALEMAVRQAGLYQLHSAGLIDPHSGAGALFVGPSGSGKSTIAIRLAARGWRYLTDDALLLSGDAEGVTAWASRRIFAARDSSLASCALPKLEDAFDGFMEADPSKRRLLPDAVFPGGFAESCVPRRLFFPRVTGEARSRVIPCSQAEAMSRLIKFSAWAADYDRSMAREHLRLLGQLVRQCRPHVLLSGLDILSGETDVSTLLSAGSAGDPAATSA